MPNLIIIKISSWLDSQSLMLNSVLLLSLTCAKDTEFRDSCIYWRKLFLLILWWLHRQASQMCALTRLHRQCPVIRQVHCDLSVLFMNTAISAKNVHANFCQRVGQSRRMRVAFLLCLWKHFRNKHVCFHLNRTVQSCSLHCEWQNRSFLEHSQIVTQTESFWARAQNPPRSLSDLFGKQLLHC